LFASKMFTLAREQMLREHYGAGLQHALMDVDSTPEDRPTAGPLDIANGEAPGLKP
jgi:hypothetical protein